MPGSQRYNGDESESKDANASHSKDVKIDLIPKTSKITSKIIDRGYGINSRIKGHLRCGGTWKAKIHGRYCPVLITNEHNTIQTCMFCFSKTSRPLKLVIRKNRQYLHSVNGTSVCTNPSCVLRSRGETHKGRDFCRLSLVCL
ncbi:hypothetical protein MAM1_0061c03801 [Mucor ambiguus]|uniref:Uncharacterized protein n=1 Tax=Mucor ambiguus TaxID=91626 RepID=A0A0C9M4S2_9FUNG|nr:hypothetical protein MAM1_0061c03801 [Mucor ambiguus]